MWGLSLTHWWGNIYLIKCHIILRSGGIIKLLNLKDSLQLLKQTLYAVSFTVLVCSHHETDSLPIPLVSNIIEKLANQSLMLDFSYCEWVVKNIIFFCFARREALLSNGWMTAIIKNWALVLLRALSEASRLQPSAPELETNLY